MKYLNNQEGSWIPGKSYRKKVLLDNIDGRINLIQDVIIKPLGEIPLHKHQLTDEIFYIIKGRPLLKIKDKDIEAGVGDLILISKRESHGFVNNGKEEVRLICLKINYKEGDSYLD